MEVWILIYGIIEEAIVVIMFSGSGKTSQRKWCWGWVLKNEQNLLLDRREGMSHSGVNMYEGVGLLGMDSMAWYS